MKYISKLSYVDAWQWSGEADFKDAPEWLKNSLSEGVIKVRTFTSYNGVETVLTTDMFNGFVCHNSDYLVRYNEYLYGCMSKEMFEAKYEPFVNEYENYTL